MKLKLRSDLRVEAVDGEVVVLDRSGAVAHRLVGDAAAALDLLADGVDSSEVPGELADAVDELVDAGLVDHPTSWSRRRFVAVGGAGLAAASVSSFVLASPAAAASACPGGVEPSPLQMQYDVPGSYTYTTGPGVTSLLVRAWGGGGGGGAGHSESSGGGGGGGHFVNNTALPVTACTAYQLTVGAGGRGGVGEEDPGAIISSKGEVSDFNDTVWAGGGYRGLGGIEVEGGQDPLAPGGSATGVNDGGGWTSWHSGGKGGDGTEIIGAHGGGGGGGAGFGGDGGDGADGSGSGAGGAGGAGIPGRGSGGAGGDEAEDGAAGTQRGGGGGGGGQYQSTQQHPEGRVGDGGAGADGAIWIGI